MAKFTKSLKVLQDKIDAQKAIIEDETNKIKENPVYALEWSYQLFRTAAGLEMFTQLRDMLQNVHDNDRSLEEFEENVARHAKSEIFSNVNKNTTLPTSNMMSNCIVEVWANELSPHAVVNYIVHEDD